ncbi:chemotaxis protein CheW [Bdellovibrionota bacterium FG-2]
MDSINDSMNRETPNKNTHANTTQTHTSARFLTFTVRGKQYATPLLRVLQITALSSNPNTQNTKTPPTHFNHRGKDLKVINLGVTQITRETALIALESNTNACAILVDSVDDIVAQNAVQNAANNISIFDSDKI